MLITQRQVAGGKGVMRSMMCEEDFTAEVIPVDQAINGLIGVAYTVSNMKSKLVFELLPIFKFIAKPTHFRSNKVPVFTLTCSEKKRTTWGFVLNEGKRINYDYPFEGLHTFGREFKV